MLFVLTLLSFALVVSSAPSQKTPKIDEVILSLGWKRSTCCRVNELSRPLTSCSHCSFNDDISDWTIHGFWPSNSKGKLVEDCPSALKVIRFDKYLPNLLTDMKQHWPSSIHGTDNNGFWWHQWKKHGTCAVSLPATSNHMNYFSKAIGLYHQRHAGKTLKKKNIVPRKESYTLAEINTALKEGTNNRKVVVRCLKRGGVSYLHEVRICYDTTYFLKDCSGSSNCDADVVYP